ncbi:MAG: hypothetical protein ACI82A_001142 [Candidatus Azotimanducaceae bacterium]|jgi:hypothetical protein
MRKLLTYSVFVLLSISSLSVFAITPGNISLKNTATLTYAGNTTGIQANATVKVNVIASSPTLSTVADIIKAENQAITTEAQYAITATNNGIDTYTFQPSALSSGTGLTDTSANVNFTGVSYTYESGGSTVTSLELGASAISVKTTNVNTITVPSDGGTADALVNGLQQNDKVFIVDTVYTITGVVSDDGSNPVVLTLDKPVPANLDVGTGVFEQKTFTVVTSGTNGVGSQTSKGTTTTYDVKTTLQTTLTSPAQGSATDTFEVKIVNVLIVKYVRNITRDNCTGTCTPLPYDNGAGGGSENYYRTDAAGDGLVDARPTEVLEYLLVMTTPTDSGLTNAVVSDVLAEFTTYKAATLRLNATVVEDEGGTANPDGNSSGRVFPLHPDTDDGGLKVQSGAPTTADAEGDGVVPANNTIHLVYQVDIS